MAKQTLNFDLIEVVIKNDRVEKSIIGVMIARFPHLVTDIFKELDDKTLATCKNVSRLYCEYLDSEKLLWIRMIQNYRKNMKNSYLQWNKILKNTPFELVNELSVMTHQFFKDDSSRSRFQWSPLQIVAKQGNLELCKYIFEKTKYIKLRNGSKWTPLHIAARKGHEEICKFLIHNSDKKNPTDDNGNTPLHFAAERGLTNICKLIIENVDNKNPAAFNGCTPLHLAAKKGHLEIIRLIVETGVDKNTLYHGLTPFHMARPLKSFTLYKLLCRDKFQLCGMILKDLLICFLMWLLLSMCLSFVLCLFLLIYDIWHGDIDHLKNISLYIFVTFVIAFPLTIMIRGCLWFY